MILQSPPISAFLIGVAQLVTNKKISNALIMFLILEKGEQYMDDLRGCFGGFKRQSDYKKKKG
jgi:hypothetical protein